MTTETLESLKTAFNNWRCQKKYLRERIPEELLRRAKHAAAVYGVGNVVRAVKIKYAFLKNLKEKEMPPKKEKNARKTIIPKTKPKFSQIEFAIPRPIAEVEIPTGIKLRMFAITPETISMMSSFCGIEDKI